MNITIKDWLLLVVFTLVTLCANAQYLPYSGEKFRTITEFKMDRKFAGDTLVNILVRSKDTTATSMMLINGKDTTAMYQIRDTAFMSTTANAWKFKPSFSQCCNGRANEILFYDSNGVVASDTSFKFFSSAPFKTFYLDANSGQLFFRTRIGSSIGSTFVMNSGSAILSNTFNTTNISRLSLDSTFTDLTYINNARQQSILIDTNGVVFQHTSGIPYLFPKESGSVGSVLTMTNTVVNGSNQLIWSNQTLSGSATLNFGSISAHHYEDLTVTVTSATDGDVVSIGVTNAAAVANASYFGWVSASNTVTIRCFNIDGGTINPPSALFKVKVFK